MTSSRRTLSRRSLLKSLAAGAAAPYVLAAASLGKAGEPAPSNRLTMGMVGLGSMGLRHVNGFVQESDLRILAVCDIDAPRRYAAADVVNKAYGNTDCATIHDFRELFARRDLDTVCLAVPDHWHSIVGIQAARAGKHIYGEKPLALTISEGRAMVREVSRTGRIWETGSWQRSTAHFRRACALVRSGRIGRLQRVIVGIGSGYRCPTQPPMPVPDGFDYNTWLGPAPEEPYTEKRCHWNFRWILDYSGGQVTDWGAHHIDIAHWGMNADDTGPVEVSGAGDFPSDGLWDAAVHFHFTCLYADGVVLEVGSADKYPEGVRFIGDGGEVFVSRADLKTQPAGLMRERLGPGEADLGGSSRSSENRQGHRRDFLDCVKYNALPIAPIEAAHRSIAVAHLGNIAMILGRKLRWDPRREEFLDDPTATRMLSRAMRSPWHI
jgi:predicted dehydrogenase